MKNNKFAKISLLVLSLALCVGAMFAMSVSAEEPAAQSETSVEIVSQNVKYTDKFALMYAVDASTATAPVKLNVYNADPKTGATPAKTYTTSELVAAGGNLEVDSYQFVTDGVAATKLTQLFYVQAVDANGNKSEVKRYSVAEYLYERLGSGEASAKQSAFYQSSIAFGTSAQKVIGKETDETKYVSNYRYVTVDGGTIEGFSAGVYPVGAELNVVKDNADNAEQWRHCYYDNIGVFANETIEGSFTVKDSAKNILALTDIDLPRLGVEDFEGFTAGDSSFAWKDTTSPHNSADGIFRGQNGTVNYSYVEDATRGIVAEIDLSNSGSRIMINRNNGVFSESEATAYECSFDMKIDMPGKLESNEAAIRLWWYNDSNVDCSATYFFAAKNVDGTKVTDQLWSSSGIKFADLDPSEWFHVRIVIYEGDNRIFFYFNGSEEYECTFRMNSAYNGDISSLEGISFVQYSNPSTIYIDNVFCGFTKEVNPTTK